MLTLNVDAVQRLQRENTKTQKLKKENENRVKFQKGHSVPFVRDKTDTECSILTQVEKHSLLYLKHVTRPYL